MALYAFGKMRYKAAALMDEAPAYIVPHLHEFKPQELSMVLYGYTQTRHYHRALLDVMAPVRLRYSNIVRRGTA